MSPRVALVLAVALVGVSAAGTLVRLAPEAHPLAIAFWRTALVAALLAPGASRVRPRDLGAIALAGGMLALHFWSWFVSLGLTSVMRSTVLVCLAPLWVGLLEAVVLRAPPPARYWAGIAVSLAGVAWLAGGFGGGAWAGDALAVVGGMLSAAYLVVGRVVRARVDITTYGAWVCGFTALTLGCLAAAVGAPLWGFGSATWGVLVALALGPQLLGHVGFNYAVGHVPAAVVAAVILLEPVGATLVAGLVLSESPSARELVGAIGILAGVGIAVWPARRPGAGVART